jgi:ribosomal protein S18 acetylase RimI-like enzyme
MKIRQGNIGDLQQVKTLALNEWTQFEKTLTQENWSKLFATLTDEKTFNDLLLNSDSFMCVNEDDKIIGFSFLVSSGNPNDIYNEQQSYIRFVTVSSKYSGQNIGQKLTESCIEKAKENSEKYIALHTSEFMNAARHIYEKIGFKIIKELEPRLGKKYWLYELTL